MTDLDTFIHNQIRSGQGIGEYYAANPSPITETLCGPGSTLANTVHVREWLPQIIAKYGITTMLDAPCGDLHWMSHTDLGDMHYTGWDISIGADEHNDTWPHVLHGPVNLLTVEDIPCFDLIVSKDFLIHMPNEAIELLIDKFRASGSAYLATTWCPSADNQDPAPLDGGQRWPGYFDRKINLEAAPFNLAPHIDACPDPIGEGQALWADKHLALYEL